jgi:small subunit ribosomal protein S3
MGQKVNPIGFRVPLAPTEMWKSRWFATDHKKYVAYLIEDIKLRKILMKKLQLAGVTRVEIERSPKSIKIIVQVTRPGIVIGRGGSGIEDLRKYITGFLSKNKTYTKLPKIDLQIEELKEPETNAYFVATKIANQLEKRLPARRVAVKAIERSMQSGAKGIKVKLSGRVNGAEISRRELYHSPTGSVPLQTLRADIDYAHVPALTRSGYVGVKVWINKGERK